MFVPVTLSWLVGLLLAPAGGGEAADTAAARFVATVRLKQDDTVSTLRHPDKYWPPRARLKLDDLSSELAGERRIRRVRTEGGDGDVTTRIGQQHKRRVMVWIDTAPGGVNASITELLGHRDAVTGICVAGACQVTRGGSLQCDAEAIAGVPRIAAAGLEAQVLISCVNATSLRNMLNHSSTFIADALAIADEIGILGWNLDFEIQDRAPDGNISAPDVFDWLDFLNRFADAMHKRGGILTMYTGIGSLIGGNLPLLASTRVDRFQTGDTYTATYSDHSNQWFEAALQYNLKAFGDWQYTVPPQYPLASRLGVGLCSAGLPGCVHFNETTVALRFDYLRTVPAITELDIWCNIPADYWWAHLRSFLSEAWPDLPGEVSVT